MMALTGYLHLLQWYKVCSQTVSFNQVDQEFTAFGVDDENDNNHNPLYQRIACPHGHILILMVLEQSRDREVSRGRLRCHCFGALVDQRHVAAPTCKALLPSIREKTSLSFKVLIFWKSDSVGKTLPSCLRSSETSWKAKHLCPSFLTPGLREIYVENAHFWASKKNKYKGRLSSWPGLIQVIKLTVENDLLLTALQCLPNNICMAREL